MSGDSKERVCAGCYEVIAPHDPEAYEQGDFFYHSKAHEDRHLSTVGIVFSRSKGQTHGEYLEN
jgi:hypothetical protein